MTEAKNIIKWLMRGGITVEDITPEQMKVLTKYWRLEDE